MISTNNLLENESTMFTQLFLSFCLLISFPTWVLANTCEGAFSNEKIFVSFAKKQRGEAFEKELGTNWAKEIAENTKHWTPKEVSQFLDFLINRIGEHNTLETIYYISFAISDIRFNDLMNMIRSYDQISKDIIDTLIYIASGADFYNDSFTTFIQNHVANKKKTWQLSQLLESYVGGTGTAYIMSHLSIREIDPNEVRRVIHFVNDYTRKYGTVTDTMENRTHHLRQYISQDLSPDLLPKEYTEQQRLRREIISFGNFSELLEFSKWVFEALREAQETILRDLSKETGTDEFFEAQKQKMRLRINFGSKSINIFYALSKAKLRNIKKIIAILERYITPEEIAKLMIQKGSIYLANPKNIQETINILKEVYNVSTDKMVSEAKHELVASHEGIHMLNKLFERAARRPITSPRELITFIMRENIDALLSASPTYLKDTIDILSTYLSREMVAIILQNKTKWYQQAHYDLLAAAESNNLQKIITALEKSFEKEEITNIIIDYALGTSDSLSNLLPTTWLTDPDLFIKTLEILTTHLDQKPILLQRVNELMTMDSSSTSELHKELTEMNNQLDPNTMKKLLTQFSLSELNPETYIIQSLREDDQSDSSSLH